MDVFLCEPSGAWVPGLLLLAVGSHEGIDDRPLQANNTERRGLLNEWILLVSGRRPRAILFRVVDDVLYVANFGRRFDRPGVISVCRENLSSKTDRGPSEMLDDVLDRDVVDAIRSKALAVYQLDRNRLQEDANHEDETRRDYAGRSLWELLQNADDALAPPGTSSANLIGAKGLGFKSVLEITDTPSVHSGPFDFGFNADTSHGLLTAIQPDPPRLTFRLPHRIRRDPHVTALLKEGYSTVVRLPFRTRKIGQELINRLRELDPHFLLLCRNLDTVVIEGPDGVNRRLSVTRRRDAKLRNSPATLFVHEAGRSSSTDWLIWSSLAPAPDDRSKSLSAAIAVQVREGVPGPSSTELPLHVFFPTAETIAARFLLHGSFALTSNRNSVRPDQHDHLVRSEIERLLLQVVEDVPPTSVVRLFSDVVKTAPGSRAKRPDRVLQQTVAQTITKAEFVPVIGGGRVRPASVRTWDHELDHVVQRKLVKDMGLAAPEIVPVFPELRTVYDAETLGSGDYSGILAGLRPLTLEGALRCMKIAYAGCLAQPQQSHIIEQIASAKIWPTADGGFRSLGGIPCLLRERPDAWPAWLPADTLHHDALALMEGGDAASQTRWTALSRRILRRPEEWLRGALVPMLADWSEGDWAKDGYEALNLIASWSDIPEFTNTTPFVETPDDTSLRSVLAAIAHVPAGKTWVRTTDAYANRDLGAPHELASYFKAVADRHVVGTPVRANATFGAKRWKALLRWLGVSWEPKVILVGRNGWLDDQPAHPAFWQALQERGIQHINQEWYIEHFPAALERLGPSHVSACVVAIAKATASLAGQWRKVSNAARAHAPAPFRSFAEFQLRQERYLPQKTIAGHRLPRLAPHELFWPGQGIPGVTPILDLGTNNKLTRAGLKAVFVDRLQVHTSLPKDWTTWCDWSDELLARVRNGDQPQPKALRDFYDALLDTFDRPEGRRIQEVVGQLPGQEPSIIAAMAAETIWIDQGRFENQEVLRGLGLLGKPILPIRLERGDDAVEVLGVRKASQVLAVAPSFEEAPDRRTWAIERQVKRRRGALAAICATKNQPLRTLPQFRAVQDLRLEISLDGETLADRSSPVYFDGTLWLVNLQAPDMWEAVATALAEQFGGHAPDLKYRFARILKARGDEVRTILAEDGIPDYRIKEALRELEDELGTSSSGRNPDDDEEGREDDTTDYDNLSAADQGGSDAGVEEFGADDEESSEASDGQSDGGVSDRQGNGGRESRLRGGIDGANGELGGRRKLNRRSLFGGGRGQDVERRRGRNAGEAAGAAAEQGLRAEAWLMRQVVDNLSLEWECLANIRDDELRETDLLLSRGGEEWHVEVKSLSSERIYWSELEREKAERLPGRYLMALLVERSGEGYAVHWSWDPLADLERCARRIEWLWQATAEGPSIREGWMPEAGLRWPERQADRYVHAVRVTEEDLDRLQMDGPELMLLRTRIGDVAAPRSRADQGRRAAI